MAGQYSLEGSALTMVMGLPTLAACPPGSQGDSFVANLSAVAGHFFESGQLLLDLQADGGTMRFTAQPGGS